MRLFSNSVLIIFIYFSDRGWYNIDFRSSYQSEYQRRLESSDPLYNSHPNAHVLHYHPQHPYRRFGRSWTQKLGAKKKGRCRCKLIQMMCPSHRCPKESDFIQRYSTTLLMPFFFTHCHTMKLSTDLIFLQIK